eukprot:2360981-Amphidinium_carterae.1
MPTRLCRLDSVVELQRRACTQSSIEQCFAAFKTAVLKCAKAATALAITTQPKSKLNLIKTKARCTCCCHAAR